MGDSLIRQDWEGRSIDGKIPLLEWLGGARDRGVFLTVRQGIQRAAIKLFVAGDAEADAYLAQWEAAQSLTHLNLMPILEFGRCNLDGVDLVYMVTERADDNLAHILKDKALDASEATNVFDPIVGALSFLHDHSVIHGHVKPSNIFKAAGKWKLSSDDLWQAGGIIKQVGYPDDYNAPEALDHRISPAVDSWSVGMTLVEALTQHGPKWNWSNGGAPAVPPMLVPPLSRVVLECLRVDPKERCTMTQLRLRLEGAAEVKEAVAPAAPIPAPQAPREQATSQETPDPNLRISEVVPPGTPAEAASAPPAIAAEGLRQSTGLEGASHQTEGLQTQAPAEPAKEMAAARVDVPHAAAAPAPSAPQASSQAPAAEKPSQPKPAPQGPTPEQKAQATPASAASSAKVPDAGDVRRERPSGRTESAPSSHVSDRPSNERPSQEAERDTPFESSRPRQGRMLFALGNYEEAEEEDRPRRRIWPWVLGFVVLLAGAAYLAVHFSTGSAPSSNLAQAPAAGQPATRPQVTQTPTPAAPQAQTTQPAQPAPQTPPPAADQSAQQPTPSQSSSTAQPAAGGSAPAPAPRPSAQAAQTPAATTNAAPAPATTDKTATASSPSADEGKSMEGVSRPPSRHGLSATAKAADLGNAARSPNADGDVTDRVMPNVSPAARGSMRRPVEVEIRVAVDRLGTVERTEYMDHGPGNYFARTAYRAAHDWRFAPPLRDGRPQASIWLLTFSFSRRNTEVTATEEDR